jgi:hypothetical protein
LRRQPESHTLKEFCAWKSSLGFNETLPHGAGPTVDFIGVQRLAGPAVHFYHIGATKKLRS